MIIDIHIDTSAPMSALDNAILAAIHTDAAEDKIEPAPRTRRPRKTSSQPLINEEPKGDPEPEESDDTPNTEAANDQDLKAVAVARATELVSKKQADVVKAALAKVGAKRVSELTKDADIEKFLAALP